MIVPGYEAHCVVMILLYVCQGVITGTVIIFPLLILQMHPEWPAGEQATMGLPLYAFALKFLWAPLLDRCYWGALSRRHIHRRVQWVAAVQVLLGVSYLYVLLNGADDYLLAVTVSRAHFWSLFNVLSVLSFGCATQDVAVDAWTVEGLPQERSDAYGSLQLIGTVTGVSLCNLFVQVNSLYPAVFNVSNFCVFSGLLCVATALGAVFLALRSRPLRETAGFVDYTVSPSLITSCRTSIAPSTRSGPGATVLVPDYGAVAAAADSSAPPSRTTPLSPDTAAALSAVSGEGDSGCEVTSPAPPPGLLAQLRVSLHELVSSQGLREVLLICLSRGWPTAMVHLETSRLVSLRIVSAATLSRYRLYCSGLMLAFLLLGASRVTSRFHAASIVRRSTAVEFALSATLTATFLALLVPARLLAGDDGDAPRVGRLWFGPLIFLPTLLVLAIAGSLTSISSMTLNSGMARRFPAGLGGVLTLLNAVGNLGHNVPHTLCLYLADVVVRASTAATGVDTGYAGDAHHSDVTPTVGGGKGGVSTPPPVSGQTKQFQTHQNHVPWWWFRLDIIVCATVMFLVAYVLRRRYLVPSAIRLRDALSAEALLPDF